MKRILLLTLVAVSLSANLKSMETPGDRLTDRLFAYAAEGRIAYGHQDDLCYGHGWYVEDYGNDPLERSDVKAVTGKYPMVMGFDLGGIETGDGANLDGIPFGLILKASRKHIERGGIVTYSWHPRNPLTGGDAWDVSTEGVVTSILPCGEKHAEFGLWLKRLGDFFEELGPDASVIFRPWHENSGSWFWWGEMHCPEQEYRWLYRLTWEYLTQERHLENILWCYSPNGPIPAEQYLSRYPGDDVVDILGTDIYEIVGTGSLEEAGIRYISEVREMLDTLTVLGREHQKPICLSETGLEGLPDLKWWTERLYPAIRDYPVSYVLTWRNAHDRPSHFYAAWEGFEGAPDMKAFCELDTIVLLDENS